MITNSLNSFARAQHFFKSGRDLINQGLKQPHGQHKTDAGEDMQMSTIKPQKIVDRQLFNSLEKTLIKDGLSLRGLDHTDFTPVKVADRIVGAVNQALGMFKNDHPQGKESGFFDQVRTGIEKGFNEARDILHSLNALQGQVAQDIDETYDLVQKGLDRLEFKQPEPVSSMQYQELGATMDNATEMQITTREGDVVTIAMSQSFASHQSEFQMQHGRTTINGFEKSESMNSSFNVSIEGELDKGEKKAIKKLLHKMHKVADKFFKGDIKSAFYRAQKIGFNSDQIAGFSMDLKMDQSVKAVSEYQQTRQTGQAINTGMIRQAADFMEQARGMLSGKNQILAGFEKPDSTFKELFSGVAKMTADSEINQDHTKDLEMLGQIVNKLVDSTQS